MTEQAEHQLLRRAQAGDYDAFEQLHALLEPPVKRFVSRLIGPVPEADDITQDTFIALYTHLCAVNPAETLRPYVFRIARNRCYDVLRRRGRYEHVSLDDEPMEVRVSFQHTALSDAPEDVTHWLLLRLEVQEAIDRLPELQRETLILYCEEELSYAEIAAVMNVSIGTVKSRLFHARSGLRGLLRPETLRAIQY